MRFSAMRVGVLAVVGVCASLSAWAGPIDTTSAHVVGDDFQIDYAPAKEPTLTVVSPAGVQVEVLEGLNRVAKGKTPLTFEAHAAGIFIVVLHPHTGPAWETPVSVRIGEAARLRVSPSHARGEASLRDGQSDLSAEPLSALEFAALRHGLKSQSPGRRVAMLEKMSGPARFTPRQAEELVGLFSGVDRPRIQKWVRARLAEPATVGSGSSTAARHTRA